MKIAFLNIYQGKVNRGVETYVTELSRRLKKNHEVELISGDTKRIPEWRKSFFWRVFLDPNSIAVAGFTFKNLNKIIKNRYDIVIPINGGWQPALVRIVTWFYGGKMIISGQSGIGWHERNNLWSFPNAFVALTNHTAGWASRVNPFVKTIYVPNGVDLKSFESDEPGTVTKQKRILCVGAFTEQKRLDLTIDAVAKLHNISLVIAGGGGEKKEEIADYGVKVLGKERFKATSVPFEKMPELYRSADVFTLPSKSTEAFGNVLVEAMATNLPVVATDDPIRREIVGDAGLFVDPTDIEAYSQALQKALDTKWGDKPRKQAEKFDWDNITEKYEELFKDIV